MSEYRIYIIYNKSYEYDGFEYYGDIPVFIGTDYNEAKRIFDIKTQEIEIPSDKWHYHYCLCSYPDNWWNRSDNCNDIQTIEERESPSTEEE